MIYTSSHKNWHSDQYKTYAISGNRGKDAHYQGTCYPALAPKLSFWRDWHANIGVIPEKENNEFYIREYYNQVLAHLDPAKVYNDLANTSSYQNQVLLCYEDNLEFCHRHIVAAWLELFLGIEVPEQISTKTTITSVPRPSYIKEYLEEYIKNNINMHGYNSLESTYLYEKAQELYTKAAEYERATGQSGDTIRLAATMILIKCDSLENVCQKKLIKK